MNNDGRYILDKDDNVIPCPDLMEWAEWVGKNPFKKVLCRTMLPDTNRTWVSTVFLGLDHSFGTGAPLLWETMIFNGEHDGWQDRYSTRDEAILGHLNALDIARGLKTDES